MNISGPRRMYAIYSRDLEIKLYSLHSLHRNTSVANIKFSLSATWEVPNNILKINVNRGALKNASVIQNILRPNLLEEEACRQNHT